MPELPEVETLAQQLRRRLTGKKIIFMDILDRKVVEAKIKKILPTRVIKVWRRAKSIIIELEKEKCL
ncbi:MAG TPA: DNA-formamidopyrimidine glycosylase family protein, partial [Candidatus Nanoarchaeia archaeon]|nr:DNA-formamidopyrimidine glycosylase family protein [Candidatus Nanoarchaeia archaeon]